MGIGIDEQEPVIIAGKMANEIAGIAEANYGLVGINNAERVPGAIGEDLEVMGCHVAANVGVCAQQFLDYDRVKLHPQRNRKSCLSSECFQALILYGRMCKCLRMVYHWA
ncbi:UNVERIFIED_CONTAM: hypothetical protein Sindi_1158400 [Sesamum indicum]